MGGFKYTSAESDIGLGLMELKRTEVCTLPKANHETLKCLS